MEDQQKQLDLITEMINTARKEFSHNGVFYLLWGWLVCIAAVSQYILIQMKSEYNSYPWMLMLVGFVVHMILIYRERNRQKTRTHVGRIVGYIWMAFGISLFITLSMQVQLGIGALPMVMVLYATGIFISGGAIQVKALIWGAVGCWICAAVAFFVTPEQQLLLLAAAVIVAYIIPGYVLNARHKKLLTA
jgi:hypothetical protein